MNKHRRMLSYCLLLGVVLPLSGCFGSFELTRSVYRANRNVYGSVSGDATQRKLAQSAVMWLLSPVYLGAAIGDAAVFNVIEFWTGSRAEVTLLQGENGTSVALEPSRDGQSAVLTVTRDDGQVIARDRLVKISPTTMEIRDAEGQLKGLIVRSEPGRLRIQDPSGATVRTIAART